MRLIMIIAGMTIAWAGTASAQRVHVSVDEVSDKRSTNQFFNECEVELKLMGDPLVDAMGVKNVVLTKAVDDTGRDLIPDEQAPPMFFHENDEPKNQLEHTVKLKNPARQAQSIAEIAGEIELFKPTDQNGGRIVVEDFMSRPAEPLAADTLEPHEVEVAYMTKEAYEQKKQEVQKQGEEKLGEAAQQMGEAMTEAMMEMLQGMMGGMLTADENSLQFFVHDPQNRVVMLNFIGPDGEEIDVQGRMSAGDLRSFSFAEMPDPATTRLVIYLATPEATQTVPFEVKDVYLP